MADAVDKAPPQAAGAAAIVSDEQVRPLDRLPRLSRLATEVLAVAFALFHIYTALFGVLEGMRQRVVHVGIALMLTFLLRPTGGRATRIGRVVDVTFILIVAVASAYLFTQDDKLDARMGLVYTIDIVFGVCMTVALLEATRRLTGSALPLIAGLTIVYAYFGPHMPALIAHKGFTVEDITVTLLLTTEGIYGVPTAVSSTYIVLFIILGAVLQESGAGRFFSDLAYGLFGRVRGGPAKVAVVASSLFGMISGSAVANVVGTGVLTIPLMKRIGFSPRFAGAVEAVASTGGQIMPPIMASAAFVIAEVLGITYMNVALAAAIPAMLYYAAIFVAVDLRAARLGMRGQSRDELPQVGAVIRHGGYLILVPLTLILLMTVGGFSPLKAGVFTIGVNILLFLLKDIIAAAHGARLRALALLVMIHALAFVSHALLGHWPGMAIYAAGVLGVWAAGRLGVRRGTQIAGRFIAKVGVALRAGGIGTLEVAACCATAGIIIGVFMLTGLGLRMSGVLVDLAGGNLPLLLILTMIASLVLGMGIPTIGAYIILAILVAPGMVQMGVHPLAAHLFIFFFGVISCITPPVALAAYAAASISGASPMRTGFTACRLGVAAYIIPFVMVYNTEMIMQGEWSAIIGVALTAIVGIAAIAAAFEGFWLTNLHWRERVALAIAGLTCVKPGIYSDLAGILLIVVVLVFQVRRRRGISKMAVPPLPI